MQWSSIAMMGRSLQFQCKEIKINNEEILRCPISGILVGKTAKEILDKIASEFDFKVNKSSQGWIIEGGQCK